MKNRFASTPTRQIARALVLMFAATAACTFFLRLRRTGLPPPGPCGKSCGSAARPLELLIPPVVRLSDAFAQAKIVATIGPASDAPETLAKIAGGSVGRRALFPGGAPRRRFPISRAVGITNTRTIRRRHACSRAAIPLRRTGRQKAGQRGLHPAACSSPYAFGFRRRA